MNRKPDDKPTDMPGQGEQSQRQGNAAQDQSQRQGNAAQDQSQRQGNASNDPSQRQGKPSNDPAQRGDKERSQSSDDGGAMHDADRGTEGNKTQRNQEDKIGTDKDRTPPLKSPQDDLA